MKLVCIFIILITFLSTSLCLRSKSLENKPKRFECFANGILERFTDKKKNSEWVKNYPKDWTSKEEPRYRDQTRDFLKGYRKMLFGKKEGEEGTWNKKFQMAIHVNTNYYSWNTLFETRLCKFKEYTTRKLINDKEDDKRRVMFIETNLDPRLKSSVNNINSLSNQQIGMIKSNIKQAGGLENILAGKVSILLQKEVKPALEKLFEFFKKLFDLEIYKEILELFDNMKNEKDLTPKEILAINSFPKQIQTIKTKGWADFVGIILNTFCGNLKTFSQAFDDLLEGSKAPTPCERWTSFGNFFGGLLKAFGTANK